MADAQVLGDYDPEQVVLTLSATKAGEEIVPSQYGPDTRISIGPRPRSESAQGMGGTVVRSHLHDTLTTLSFTLMPSDPVNQRLSALVDTGELFEFTVKDNNGVASQVAGRCWFNESAAWNRNRTVEPITWNFEAQVKRGAMQHGSTVLLA